MSDARCPGPGRGRLPRLGGVERAAPHPRLLFLRAFGLAMFGLAVVGQAGAAGQSAVVVPPGLDARDGNTLDWATARYLPCRAQCVYDRSLLAGLGSRTIRGLATRAEYAPRDVYPAHDVVVTLRMGSSDSLGPWAASTESYARNHPADFTTVLNAVRVAYPAVQGGAPNPRGFLRTALATPFAYRAGRHLVLQWDNRSPSGSPETWLWYDDAERLPPTGGVDGRFTSAGVSCPAGLTFSGRGARPGGEMSWWFYSDAPNSTPALGVIGLSRSSWAGLSLPYSLAGLGAPGCSVYAGQDARIPGRTDASSSVGRIRYDVLIPPDVSISNRTVFVQTFVLDPSANALGVRVSPLGIHAIGTPLTHFARLLLTFSKPIDDQPQSVFADALVLRLD